MMAFLIKSFVVNMKLVSPLILFLEVGAK